MKEKSYSYVKYVIIALIVPEYGFDKTRKMGTWRNEEIQRWNPIKKNDKTIDEFFDKFSDEFFDEFFWRIFLTIFFDKSQ